MKAIEKESPQDGKYFQKWQDNDSTDLIDYTPTNEPEVKEVLGYRSTSSGRGLDPSDFQLVRNESFIARRRGSNGELGPEAVFGRYNVSVMMTRSLGDRYGPRGCFGVPDVKAVTVLPNQHARFVIATDGLWDVVPSEYIRCNALRSKYVNPKVFANALAQKARKLRERQGLRMDDITVIVVDVNGGDANDMSKFRSIDNKHGSDFVIDGISESKSKDHCNCIIS